VGRPERHDVDYFPFFAKRGRTLNILESKFGLEGIGFFTNLLRFLALTPDHYYCIKEEDDRLNFFAEIGMSDENRGIEIIETMIKTGKLDKALWENHKVLASKAFLESLKEAYKRRSNDILTIEAITAMYESGNINPVSDDKNPDNADTNPQSKEKKSKAKKSKSESETETPKQKRKPLREREPLNDMERVEKKYLMNWDVLYNQRKVQTADPVVSWNQTRALLKTHLDKLSAEQIIQAIDNGMDDDFVMNAAYSLSIMLSASVLNRLINARKAPPKLTGKESLSDLTTVF